MKEKSITIDANVDSSHFPDVFKFYSIKTQKISLVQHPFETERKLTYIFCKLK